MQTTPPFRLSPLLAANLLGTMAMMAYVAMIGPVVRTLGVSELIAGISMACGGVFWMVMARHWGRLSDRRGRKPVLLLGLSTFALAYLVLAVFVDHALRNPAIATGIVAAVLIGVRSVIGAFYAAVPPAAAASIADHIPADARQQAMARLGSSAAIGMVAGPAAASAISAHGLQWGFYASVLLPALGFLAIALWLPAAPAVAARPPAGRTATALSLFDPRLRLPMLSAFVAMVCVSVAQVVVGFYVMDRLGLDAQAAARAAGYALTCVGLSLIISQQVVMRSTGGSLVHWIIAGAAISAAGFVTAALAQSQSLLLLGYAIGAFGMGFIFPSFQAMAANAVAPHEQGAAAGNASAAQGLGMVLGPLIGTVLYQLAPAMPYLFISTLLLLTSACFWHFGRHRN